MSDEFISREDPVDTDAFFEFQSFNRQESNVFFGCRATLVEDGVDLPRAERDAAAAILQHRRLHAPRTIDYLRWLKQQNGAQTKDERSEA